MNAVILETLKSFNLDIYRPIFHRELTLGEPLPPHVGNLVTVVTGVRRCGKTFRLFQMMDELHNQGVSWSRMLYFNFEDSRLAPIIPSTGDEILEAFYRLYPAALTEGAFFFFDEIQAMEDWGAWLRRVIDTYPATVYVTGSSSRMLSTDIATEFRGRSWECELSPFSFREYVNYHGVPNSPTHGAYSMAERIALEKAFAEYLVKGGFPAIQNLPGQIAISVLQGYAQQVVSRDVVERHNMGNLRAIMAFARKTLASSGRELSLRKCESELKSQKLTIGRATLSEVVGCLEDAFMIHRVREFTRALAERDSSTVKLYAVDTGLACANSPASSQDTGQRLECAVYNELRRRRTSDRDGAIGFLRTREHRYGVDFCMGDALFDDASCLCQVTQSLDDPATYLRETRALWEALVERGLGEATIIVQDGTMREERLDGRLIRCVPAWQWMLER